LTNGSHIRALKRFLIASHAEKMWINTKAVFATKCVSFVGLAVSYDGVACNPDKVEAIYNLPESLKSKQEVRMFLGKCMFFSSFVPAMGEYTACLFKMLQKEHPEKWDPSDPDVWNPQTHGAAVKLLKDVLCTYPVLRLPDTTKQFFVLSDSSTRAGGCCLGQRDDETGKLYAVGYASKVWSDTQTKYTCTELELLSVLLALKKWRPLLLGTTVVVRIYTDHSANASLHAAAAAAAATASLFASRSVSHSRPEVEDPHSHSIRLRSAGSASHYEINRIQSSQS
jgi:hypothetical protein